MNTQTTLLDPTAELKPVERQLLPRLVSLDGATIGLLDISKPRGKEFLDEIEKQLLEMGAQVKRYSKPTFTRVAPTELTQKISVECDAVIEGLAA
jgi:phage-related tail protein